MSDVNWMELLDDARNDVLIAITNLKAGVYLLGDMPEAGAITNEILRLSRAIETMDRGMAQKAEDDIRRANDAEFNMRRFFGIEGGDHHADV